LNVRVKPIPPPVGLLLRVPMTLVVVPLKTLTLVPLMEIQPPVPPLPVAVPKLVVGNVTESPACEPVGMLIVMVPPREAEAFQISLAFPTVAVALGATATGEAPDVTVVVVPAVKLNAKSARLSRTSAGASRVIRRCRLTLRRFPAELREKSE